MTSPRTLAAPVTWLVVALGVARCDGPAGRRAPEDAAVDVAVEVVDAGVCQTDATPSPTCPLCRPSARSCSDDGRAIRRCQTDGLSYVEEARCDVTRGELCSEGRCVVPCDHAAASRSYQGCEFYATNTLNSGLGRYFEDTSREGFPFGVAVTNPWPVEVRLTLEGGGLRAPRTETVAARGSVTIELPWVTALAEGGGPDAIASTFAPGGAVRIRASASVAVYQFNPLSFASREGCDEARCYSYTNDASLLLPVAALRRQYVTVTRPTVRVLPQGDTRWRRSGGFITVVGVTDETADVRVRLHGRSTAGTGVPAGVRGAEIVQRLNRGDVLQLVSDLSPTCMQPEPDTIHGDVFCRPVAAEDLTGSVIESSEPVAVFVGHDCALVPHDRFACDHLEEQLFPVESLGRNYIVSRPPATSDEPALLRIVATRAATRVTFEPTRAHAETTLAAGDFVEFEQRESVAITASEPVLVAQFLVGAGYDRASPINVRGDPDMVLIAPVDQVRGGYNFLAAPGFQTSTAIAMVPTGEALRLDGRALDLRPAGSVAGHDLLYVSVSPGPHTLEALRSGVRFGLIVSGLAHSTSYSYPAGLDLAPIAPPL